VSESNHPAISLWSLWEWVDSVFGHFLRPVYWPISWKSRIAVQAVRLLLDGKTVIFLTNDGTTDTKMIVLDKEPLYSAYYPGSITQFDPNAWGSYRKHESLAYLIKNVPSPMEDYLPLIASGIVEYQILQFLQLVL